MVHGHKASGPRAKLKDERTFGFCMVDNRAVDRFGPIIGGTALAVYVCLVRHADRDREAWPSSRRLSELTGFSRQKVLRSIQAIVECGLIRVIRKAGKINVYRIAQITDDGLPEAAQEINQACDPGGPLGPLFDDEEDEARATQVDHLATPNHPPACDSGGPLCERGDTPEQNGVCDSGGQVCDSGGQVLEKAPIEGLNNTKQQHAANAVVVGCESLAPTQPKTALYDLLIDCGLLPDVAARFADEDLIEAAVGYWRSIVNTRTSNPPGLLRSILERPGAYGGDLVDGAWRFPARRRPDERRPPARASPPRSPPTRAELDAKARALESRPFQSVTPEQLQALRQFGRMPSITQPEDPT